MTDIVERLRFDAVRCEVCYSKGIAGNIEEGAAEIERLRAALLDVPIYSENTRWREKHKDLLRSIGAWMGSAVDPGGRILETDRARKQ